MDGETEIRPYRGNYLVSSDGRVFSTHTWNDGEYRELRQETLNKYGYKRVTLYIDGYREKRLVHVMVLETFVGPKPSERHEVRHLDGNPDNNAVSNLAWGTKMENVQDAIKHGTYVRGSRSPNARLTEEQVVEIRQLIEDGNLRYREIGERYGVSKDTIANIATRSWQHV